MQILNWGLIGPYFFENGNAITEGVRYRKMTSNFLSHEINDFDAEDIVSTRRCNVSQLLSAKFNGCVISGQGDVNWPYRSCDLTQLNFYS